MNAVIKAISYYLPEKVLTNKDISVEFPEWTVEKITDKIGIKIRHIAGENEFSSDLAVQSAKKLFSENKISPEEIDYLIFCTQSPDYFLPTSACIIQDRLGIPTTAGAIDINLGCSGYIYALGLAKGLIETGQSKNVLLLMGETYSKFMNKEDKSNRSIFGDAASATLVTESIDGFIGNFIYGTDGKGYNNLIVKNGGMRFPKNNDISDNLYMNGAEIFVFSLKTVPAVVSEMLIKYKLSLDQIDVFIFHQANKYMLETIRKKIGIEGPKFYYYMEDIGNTVSSTIPIALSNAIKDGKVKKGDKVLLVGFGVGYSWGGCIIQI